MNEFLKCDIYKLSYTPILQGAKCTYVSKKRILARDITHKTGETDFGTKTIGNTEQCYFLLMQIRRYGAFACRSRHYFDINLIRDLRTRVFELATEYNFSVVPKTIKLIKKWKIELNKKIGWR